MSDSCKSCLARILWAQSESGKAIPLDPEPTANGNLVLLDPLDPREPPIASRVDRRPPGVPLYVAHFVTCPQAAQHRKSRGGPR